MGNKQSYMVNSDNSNAVKSAKTADVITDEIAFSTDTSANGVQIQYFTEKTVNTDVKHENKDQPGKSLTVPNASDGETSCATSVGDVLSSDYPGIDKNLISNTENDCTVVLERVPQLETLPLSFET